MSIEEKQPITLYERLHNSWSKYIYERKTPTAQTVKSQFGPERTTDVTFKRLVEYHDKTPQVQIAVSSYKELITGTELVISSENEKAKDIIDTWNRQTNFYAKFENMVATMLITGNAILEKLDTKAIIDVEEVDMTSILGKKRTDEGDETLYYEHADANGSTIKLGEGNMDKFIEFNLTMYSKQPFGRSLFYSLAVPRVVGTNRRTAPLIEILWSMEDAMAGIILNNAYPIIEIVYAGANDKILKREAEKWRTYKPGDKRLTKFKSEFNIIETQAASKYTDYVTHIEKAVEIGTQFPHDIMTGDFTSRASSETTETIVMKKVRGIQQYLANRLKTELYDVILEQNGIKPDEADLKVSFTAQNIVELDPEQVLKLFQANAITTMEMREWYRANTGIDLPEDKQLMQDALDRTMAAQELPTEDTDTADKLKGIESKLQEFNTIQNTDTKLQELYNYIRQEINSMKGVMADKREQTNQKQLNYIDNLMDELEKSVNG